jgi:sterol desaturase/sphingolipid hydroxylase (fatty acid hydroxylase superfamily)
MQLDSDAAQQVFVALRSAYSELILSIPLVALGIAITGSIFYFAVVRPQVADRSLSAWLTYLLPPEQYTSKSARVDLWVWLINGLLIVPIYEICVVVGGMIAGVGFNERLAQAFGARASLVDSTWAAVVIQFLGFYFGFGIGQYSNHLAFHKIPCLWALHRAHHSAESANLFAFLRTHPVEIFLGGAVRVVTMAIGMGIAIYFTDGTLLPETAATLFWYNAINVVAGFRSLDHTHIPVRYGKVLDIIIGSPIMHQVHHSAELRHRDVNLAGAGYIYDWLFGTLYIPERGETWRWGLNDEELGEANPHNRVRHFFLEPMTRMRSELKKIVPRRAVE